MAQRPMGEFQLALPIEGVLVAILEPIQHQIGNNRGGQRTIDKGPNEPELAIVAIEFHHHNELGSSQCL